MYNESFEMEFDDPSPPPLVIVSPLPRWPSAWAMWSLAGWWAGIVPTKNMGFHDSGCDLLHCRAVAWDGPDERYVVINYAETSR